MLVYVRQGAMVEPGYIVRYRSCSIGKDSALIVEDERGDLYACTRSGLAVRIRLTHMTPLVQRGWIAVPEAPKQSLETILGALTPAK